MYNDILSIGPFTIHGYGLMIGIGVMAALLTGDKRAQKRGMNGDLIYGLTFVAVILGFLAARVLFIITEFKDFLLNPKAYITGSGFVVFGGIMGGILSVIGYCKIKKVRAIDYIDLMAPSVALAQGFGRLGCLLAGCCYGRETDSWIGVVFPAGSMAPAGVKLLPTQLFSAGADLLMFIVLFLLVNSKKYIKGVPMAVYLTGYAIGRSIIECFRSDARGAVGGLSTSQFISIFTGIAGFVLLVIIIKKSKTEAETAKGTDLETET